ncbi:MAG: DUF4292 domain-containing protein [Saprospiraceae bacterium]|nr:DUF4292 domain-containing protein [Saprospiraceae bacterium]
MWKCNHSRSIRLKTIKRFDILCHRNKIRSLSIKYYLNGYNLELSKMEISDVKGRTASVQYSDYRAVGKHDQFSYQRVYRFPNPSGEYSTITMDLSDVEIDIPKEIIFSIPSHYERIN